MVYIVEVFNRAHLNFPVLGLAVIRIVTFCKENIMIDQVMFKLPKVKRKRSFALVGLVELVCSPREELLALIVCISSTSAGTEY